jgi:hypothetical protein
MEASQDVENYQAKVEELEDQSGKLHISADLTLDKHTETYAENKRYSLKIDKQCIVIKESEELVVALKLKYQVDMDLK